jgi:3-dehydroquinate dehydratase-2
MNSVLVIHGPNLNLLGRREPDKYGYDTLSNINESLQQLGSDVGVSVTNFQSNSEGALIDRIHQAQVDGVQGIVINPAGYTHTSVSIRDALLAVDIPFVEVHLSDPHTREAFRHHSYFSDIAIRTFSGLGKQSYLLGLTAIADYLNNHVPSTHP